MPGSIIGEKLMCKVLAWLVTVWTLALSHLALGDNINLRILNVQTKRYFNAQLKIGETIKSFALRHQEQLGLSAAELEEVALVFDGHIYRSKERITSFISTEYANFYYGENLRDLLDNKMPEVWRRLAAFGLTKKANKLRRTADKQVFTRKKWTKFQSELYLKVTDENQTEFIYNLYLKYIFPHFKGKNNFRSYDNNTNSSLAIDSSDETTLMFRIQSWLLHHIYYLGSPYFDSIKNFSTHPYFRDAKIPRPVMMGLKKFLQEVQNRKTQERLQPFAREDSFKVLILTSSGWGGGHFVVAQSIKEALQAAEPASSSFAPKGIEVELVDIKGDTLKPFDTLWTLTKGGMHSIDIYDEIYQKEHDPILADAFWLILDDLQRYVPDALMVELKNIVRGQRPDLMISCLHHYTNFIDLAYTFSTPLTIVGTDYGLQGKLFPHVELLNPALVQLWTPTADPLYFKSLQSAMHTWGEYFAADKIRALDEFSEEKNPLDQRWQELSAKLPIFRKLGFPIRKEIKKINDPIELKQYKAEFGIAPKTRSKVIMLTMGRQGVGTIVEISKELLKSDKKIGYSLYLFPLCGNNELCYRTLSELRESSDLHNMKISPQRLLDAGQMNRLYNISDMVVSKPGGATAAELLAIGIKLAAIDYHPWEYDNLVMLKSVGLGNDLVSVPAPQRSAKILETLFKWNGLHQGVVSLDWVTNMFENIASFKKEFLERSNFPKSYLRDHDDAASSLELRINGKNKFNLFRDFSQEGFSPKLQVSKSPKGLPPIVMLFMDTVRRDYALDPKNAPVIQEFLRENLSATHMVSNGTATHHTQTALFYSMPPLYRESLIRSKWSSGSPTLQILKRAGYKIHLFGRPNYYFGATEEQGQHLFMGNKWSDLTQVQVMFGQRAGTILDTYPLDTGVFGDFEKYSPASSDEFVVKEELPGMLKNHSGSEPGVFLIFLEGGHDKYSWDPDLSRDPNYADLFEESIYNNRINRNPHWYEHGLQEEAKKAYRNAIRNTDSNVANIFAQLKQAGLYDKAIIVLFSDHGERLYDGFGNWYAGMDASAEWLLKNIGHGGPPFNASISVPMAIKPQDNYGRVEQLKETLATKVIGHENIFPTMLEMAGVKASSPLRSDSQMIDRLQQKSLLKNAPHCQIAVAPNGNEDPYILAFVGATHKAFMHLHYGGYVMDEPDFTKVTIKIDALTSLEDVEVKVDPQGVEAFFKANFAGCLSALGI